MNTPTQTNSHKGTHQYSLYTRKVYFWRVQWSKEKVEQNIQKKNPEISINALAVKKLKPSKVHSSLNHGYETVCTLLRSGKKWNLNWFKCFIRLCLRQRLCACWFFLVLFLMSCSFTMCVFAVSILANTTAVNERIKLMIAGAAGWNENCPSQKLYFA